MQSARIIFKFDGRQADRHVLDPSDYIEHETAARQLLGLHAYFYLNGRVPNGGILSHGHGYHVHVAGRRDGSLEGHWLVELLIKEAFKSGAGYLAKKAVVYTYEQLLRDSIGPILARKSSSMPLELRSEPVFEPLDRSNEPFFDTEAERVHHWRQLRARTTGILANAARPVGRCADTMTILAANDNPPIGTINETRLRQLKEDAQAYSDALITTALRDVGFWRPQTHV